MTYQQPYYPPHRLQQRRGIFAILAIVAAVGSFLVSPGLAVLLGIAAVICGLIGFFMAVSPRVSGGLMSLASIVIGLIGLVAALVRAVF